MATTSKALETTKEDQTDLSLKEAFQAYVRQMPTESKKAAQPEIAKFVRYLGSDRNINSIITSIISNSNLSEDLLDLDGADNLIE